MKPPIAFGLAVILFALLSSSAGAAFEAATGASGAPRQMPARADQLAQILKFDIFRRDGFPVRSCEFRCQEQRQRCDARAQTEDERRDCRLSYSVCSNDCDVYTPSR